MFEEAELEEIVNKIIAQDENLGDQAGSSGHLGNVSCEIKEIGTAKKVESDNGDKWEITYTYTIVVVTEFTIYPDNPPHENTYRKKIIIDEKGELISESPREFIASDMPIYEL